MENTLTTTVADELKRRSVCHFRDALRTSMRVCWAAVKAVLGAGWTGLT